LLRARRVSGPRRARGPVEVSVLPGHRRRSCRRRLHHGSTRAWPGREHPGCGGNSDVEGMRVSHRWAWSGAVPDAMVATKRRGGARAPGSARGAGRLQQRRGMRGGVSSHGAGPRHARAGPPTRRHACRLRKRPARTGPRGRASRARHGVARACRRGCPIVATNLRVRAQPPRVPWRHRPSMTEGARMSHRRAQRKDRGRPDGLL
jgi:hypothetical protein